MAQRCNEVARKGKSMNKINIDQVKLKMIEFNAGDPKQIQHFIKVYEFASLIGKEEGLEANTQEILEVAALVHDIGITRARELYGTSEGKYQEKEGPALAKKLLEEIGYTKEIIDRVSFLVGHHHTFDQIVGTDYQILVEADLLVNFYEHQTGKETIEKMFNKLFKTETGSYICKKMFAL